MEAKTLLRTERLCAGLTQRALAELTGEPQSTIARIETGQTDPRVPTLNTLLIGCGQSMTVGGWRVEARRGVSERVLQ